MMQCKPNLVVSYWCQESEVDRSQLDSSVSGSLRIISNSHTYRGVNPLNVELVHDSNNLFREMSPISNKKDECYL